jgi:hypothetical protein
MLSVSDGALAYSLLHVSLVQAALSTIKTNLDEEEDVVVVDS